MIYGISSNKSQQKRAAKTQLTSHKLQTERKCDFRWPHKTEHCFDQLLASTCNYVRATGKKLASNQRQFSNVIYCFLARLSARAEFVWRKDCFFLSLKCLALRCFAATQSASKQQQKQKRPESWNSKVARAKQTKYALEFDSTTNICRQKLARAVSLFCLFNSACCKHIKPATNNSSAALFIHLCANFNWCSALLSNFARLIQTAIVRN